MSFILDALKKSEAERQRQTVPGLMDMGPPAARPRFPVWGIWLGALLGVNLIVLLVVLTRTSAPSGVAVPGAAAPAAAIANAKRAVAPGVASPPQFSPMEAGAGQPGAGGPAADGPAAGGAAATPVYAPEIPVAEANTPPANTAIPEMERAPVRQTAPVPQFGPQLHVTPPPEEKGEVLPTLAEINLSGNRGIPELHLDIHVYAAKPAGRFVFINNNKYKEGGTLAEGPTIERITRDGVVLSYQSLRFFLPRQ